MVPKLRFYVEKSIFEKTCLQKITDGIGDGIHATPTYLINGDCFFINGNNLKNGSVVLTENTKKISYQEKSKYRDNLNDRSILLSINGTIGNLAYYNNEPILLGKSAAYINVSPLYCKRWVYYILQSNSILRYFEQELTGTTIKNLSLKTIRDAVVYYPSLEEQTKISSFLSSVDEKITLLNKQCELLCRYKKSMMQKIFSQELRFKGSTSWKIENLFGLAVNNTLTNGVFNDPMNTGSGYKLINVVNMYKEPQIDEGDLTLLKLDEKTFNKNKAKNGDIFFTRSSLVKEGIAWSNIYLGNSDDITYDGHLIKMTPDETKVFPQFLYYCLKTSQVRSQLIKGGKTATMTTIGQDDVGKTSLHIPSLNEQIKIANFLSAIDDKITTKKVELDKLKTWKQGLLQQMFV